jgi:hypothetical protein
MRRAFLRLWARIHLQHRLKVRPRRPKAGAEGRTDVHQQTAGDHLKNFLLATEDAPIGRPILYDEVFIVNGGIDRHITDLWVAESERLALKRLPVAKVLQFFQCRIAVGL